MKTSQKKSKLEVTSSLDMCSCPINILDFWYNQHDIKDGLDNSEFAILYDLMAIFAVCHILLHHQKNYFHLLIMLKQKQVAKNEKNAKQTLSRSQQSGYYTACLSLKSERCQQWSSMLSALLVDIKYFE